MAAQGTRSLVASCSLGGAAVNVSFDASDIVEKLRSTLQTRLGKKGIMLDWQDAPEQAQLRIRVVQVDQGNQLLRYLLPFLAPAVLELEGELVLAGLQPVPLHYVKRAQVGLFGGSGKGMLKVCADRLAKALAKDVLNAIG
jgi:hypothetical protein